MMIIIIMAIKEGERGVGEGKNDGALRCKSDLPLCSACKAKMNTISQQSLPSLTTEHVPFNVILYIPPPLFASSLDDDDDDERDEKCEESAKSCTNNATNAPPSPPSHSPPPPTPADNMSYFFV